MKQKYFSIGYVCVLCVLAVGCAGEKKVEEGAQSVEVISPKPANETQIKVLSGVVKENSSLNLAFEINGRIEAIYWKEGDYVKAGQMIARLNNDDYELSVKALQTQRDLAFREATRKKKMFEQKALSGNEYEAAQTKLENLDAQLEIQKNRYEYTFLRAPVDGFIQKVNMHKGELAGVGSCVATMLDLSRMEVEVAMPSGLYQKRSLFGKVTCSLSGSAGKTYLLDDMKAVVKSDGNQLYKVIFRVHNCGDKELTAGMNVQVRIPVGSENKDTSLMLPSSSICKDAVGAPYVYVVNSKNLLGKVQVSVVGIEGDYVRVQGALPAECKVVKAGVQTLSEGQKVRIIQKTSSTNIGGLI